MLFPIKKKIEKMQRDFLWLGYGEGKQGPSNQLRTSV